MKIYECKTYKKFLTLIIAILVFFISGCSKTGIGGNPELLTEQEKNISEVDGKPEVSVYTFDVKSESIKNSLLSSGMNLNEEKIEQDMLYCYRLKEKRELYTIELFDAVSDGKSKGCQDIDIYCTEKMIKKHAKMSRELLKKIFKYIGFKYKDTVGDKIEKMFDEKQKKQESEQKYNNDVKLNYSWEEQQIKLRIEATDYKNEQEAAFGFNRNDVAEKIKNKQSNMSQVLSKGDDDFVERMITMQGNGITVILRDNKKDIDRSTGTEAIYVQFKGEILNGEDVLDIKNILKVILELIEGSISDKEIEKCISQYKEIEKDNDNGRYIKLKSSSIYISGESGNAEIAILPKQQL